MGYRTVEIERDLINNDRYKPSCLSTCLQRSASPHTWYLRTLGNLNPLSQLNHFTCSLQPDDIDSHLVWTMYIIRKETNQIAVILKRKKEREKEGETEGERKLKFGKQ